MASGPYVQTIIYSQFGGDQQSPLPPPPPRDAPHSSPLRRQNALLPPALSTAISSAPAGSTYSTPLSSISHRSPFSAIASSPIVVSASTPLSSHPMASRSSGNFNVPYDPRDWAPGTDTRAAQAHRSRENVAEDGLASPPPPYSPELARSPRGGLERAQTIAVPQSPPQPSASFTQRRIHPLPNGHASNRHSIHVGSYAPPPPPTNVPPMPRARLVSDMHNPHEPANMSVDQTMYPPAARRAASASAEISRVSDAGPSRSTSRQRTWLPGMPLPGPPPGPPPSNSRSQSTSGSLDRQAQSNARQLRQTFHVSDLGPVPPTPLTWSEGQPLPESRSPPTRMDAQAGQGSSYNSSDYVGADQVPHYESSHSQTPQRHSESSSSTPGHVASLSRSSALRDPSAKGLRERRAQNRNSKIFDGEFNVISVQTNPWADSLPQDAGQRRQDSQSLGGPRSARLAPKSPSPLAVVLATHDQLSASPIQMTSTPPMSPNPQPRNMGDGSRSAGLPPKALPTPPLSQKPPLSAHSILQSNKVTPIITTDARDLFEQECVQRHNEFLQKERLASSELDQLKLFAEYIMTEASLRQKRYATALASGEFDIESFRSNLFKVTPIGRSASNSVSQVSIDEREPTTGNTTPQTRPETMWWKDYQPALSPIASMDNDEMSSRGRAPSRWWESQTGSQSGAAGGRAMHRSKRESKYMGLSKEFLMAYSPSEEYPGTFNQIQAPSDSEAYPAEKTNPETFGFFENDTPRKISNPHSKKPQTPALLDISRFITLPPPYPRHHPAVNNDHPDLAEYRTTVRTLGDLDDVRSRNAKYQANIESLRSAHQRRLSDNRKTFKSSIQSQISRGEITYKEAADAEEAFQHSELATEKQQLQSEFDLLQDSVINPLHDMLHGRLSLLNSSIQKLSDDLHTDARYQDPDQPQEEGDEKPELLEKLTQLKWLFDVREQIYRECFDLLSARNNKFKEIVLLPYQFSSNTDKVRDTEKFFDQDAQTRFAASCGESLKRHESFLETIDQHVRRGVELQSSAFWDIAPNLLDLLQKIPEDLRHCEGILIPDKEYNENPSYHQHPQQYLYTLLTHAEKSTYQFIESQVNLQCLQHEVKNAALGARYRNLEASNGQNLSDHKAQEESVLTAELKQKASMIEEQWLEALGSQLQATRERVKVLLQEDGAWDEISEVDV